MYNDQVEDGEVIVAEAGAEAGEFDINDPQLAAEVPDFGDPEGSAEMGPQAPPSDGVHAVALFLRESDTKAGVEVKRTKEGVLKVQANVYGRFVLPAEVNDDGEEVRPERLGAYTRGYYPSTHMSTWEQSNLGTSKLAFLCRLAGKPLQRGMNLAEIARHVQALFDVAGEDGVRVLARTKWLKSVPVVDEDGMPVMDGQYLKRDDIKGEKRIKASVALAAKSAALEAGLGGEEVDKAVELAINNAHKFIDPVSGDELTVQCEIDSLINQ